MKLSFFQKVTFQKNNAIVLCRSRNEEGRAFYHYVLMDEARWRSLNAAAQSGQSIIMAPYCFQAGERSPPKTAYRVRKRQLIVFFVSSKWSG